MFINFLSLLRQGVSFILGTSANGVHSDRIVEAMVRLMSQSDICKHYLPNTYGKSNLTPGHRIHFRCHGTGHLQNIHQT